MKVLLVNIRVAKDRVEDFMAATMENAALSRKEPGIARFDLLQDESDPTRFVLVEVYRDAEAQARHRETAHYHIWKDLAEPMMDGQRTRAMYTEIERSGSR